MRAPLPRTEPSSRRFPSGFAGRRRTTALLVALPLAAVAATTQAIGLGEIAQQSGLGRPLRIVVPVIAAAGEEISGECFRLSPSPRSTDGIPEVLTARIALERTAAGARLVVTTLRPLEDPVVRVTLQAGCGSVVRREYTLLLDPLPIETPVVTDAAGPAGASPARPSASAVASATNRGPAAIPATTAPRTPNRRPATAAAAARAASGPAGPVPGSAAAPKPARKATVAAATASGPKLTVSTAVPGTGGPGKGAGDATAAQQQELAATLEAETIVLRQRVAELTATVDRMQQEIVAAQALQAARVAADNAAKASAQATIGRWWNDGWPILAAVIALAVLIAAGLSLRRRRSVADPPVWMRGAAPAERFAPATPEARPAAAAGDTSRAAPPTPVPAPQPPQGPDTREQSAAVAVSELPHVTEEAGVYLAFNRVDRAIEVLQQHIATAPVSLPAAWIMLLDLYRKQGRDTEFRELAQQFHLRFNVAAPSWDGFQPQAEALSGDAGAASGTVAARPAPRPATAAGLVAAAAPATANKGPRELELELDQDMLESAKTPRSFGAPPTRKP